MECDEEGDVQEHIVIERDDQNPFPIPSRGKSFIKGKDAVKRFSEALSRPDEVLYNKLTVTLKKFNDCLDTWSNAMSEKDEEAEHMSRTIAYSLKTIKHKKKRQRAQAEIFTILANYADSDTE